MRTPTIPSTLDALLAAMGPLGGAPILQVSATASYGRLMGKRRNDNKLRRAARSKAYPRQSKKQAGKYAFASALAEARQERQAAMEAFKRYNGRSATKADAAFSAWSDAIDRVAYLECNKAAFIADRLAQ